MYYQAELVKFGLKKRFFFTAAHSTGSVLQNYLSG